MASQDAVEVAESEVVQMPTGGLNDLIACLDSLPTTELSRRSASARLANQCAICLDKFAAGDSVKTLPCGDVFHSGCMEQWGQASVLCKTCGAPWRPS